MPRKCESFDNDDGWEKCTNPANPFHGDTFSCPYEGVRANSDVPYCQKKNTGKR